MKCFEGLVLNHTKACVRSDLNQHQFTYKASISTDATLLTTLTCLKDHYTYIRIMFVDCNLSFNSFDPRKLKTLDLKTSLCICFLSNTAQSVRLGKHFSFTITLKHIFPQGRFQSSFLYYL